MTAHPSPELAAAIEWLKHWRIRELEHSADYAVRMIDTLLALARQRGPTAEDSATEHVARNPFPMRLSKATEAKLKELRHDDDGTGIDRGQQSMRSVPVERAEPTTGGINDGQAERIHDADDSRRAVGDSEGSGRLHSADVIDRQRGPTAEDIPREPTDAMVLAAQKQYEKTRTRFFRDIWRAMYDAALADRLEAAAKPG